jgi:hypothetical protein
MLARYWRVLSEPQRLRDAVSRRLSPNAFPARPSLENVSSGQRRAYGSASIACRRLNPDAFESTIAQNLAVRDAIECHTTRQTVFLEAIANRMFGERGVVLATRESFLRQRRYVHPGSAPQHCHDKMQRYQVYASAGLTQN